LAPLEICVARIVSRPFDENTYVAHFPAKSDAVVFDPGFEPQAILDYLNGHSLRPAAILCTHGHSDHIAGNAALKQAWPDCPLVIGAGDAAKLTDPELNLSAAFGAALYSPIADRIVADGESIELAGLKLEVLAAPGHSIGHVVFLCRQTSPWQLFGGDVLFQGSIGRTDFPDGNFDDLRRTIQERLFKLPEDTVVLPGHGPATSIGREKKTNPFVGAPAGYRD
jgi:hydroxyacylglutathione hydrolase